MIVTIDEEPPTLVAYIQWHKRKMANLRSSLSGIALSWFLRLQEKKTKWTGLLLSLHLKKVCMLLAQVEAQILLERSWTYTSLCSVSSTNS